MTVYVYNKETGRMDVKFKDRRNKLWILPNSFDNTDEFYRKQHEESLRKARDYLYQRDPTIRKHYNNTTGE